MAFCEQKFAEMRTYESRPSRNYYGFSQFFRLIYEFFLDSAPVGYIPLNAPGQAEKVK
jgi:hypothetical protein